MSFLKDYKNRQWLYSVLAAVLVILGGYGIFTADERDNIMDLIGAILNLGGTAGLALAAAYARPGKAAAAQAETDSVEIVPAADVEAGAPSIEATAEPAPAGKHGIYSVQV